jgi:hypothetical protein
LFAYRSSSCLSSFWWTHPSTKHNQLPLATVRPP